MDRKNKKAAQQAAAASGGGEKTGGKEGRKKRDGHGGHSNNASGRNNTLLAGGSTAPTRLLSSNSNSPSSNRPPMPLKASISPSAPAPPLKDTDFASFAALDEMEGVQLPVPPAHGKSQAQEADGSADSAKDGQAQSQSTPSPVPLPTSAPRVTATMTPSEFGPIGSPPSANRNQQAATGLNNGTFTPGTSPRGPHLNGVNLGTSPQTGPGFMSSSPFSAPGTQSVFMNNSYAAPGVAASLGSGLAMMGGRRGWGDVDVSASPAKGGLSMLASSVQRSSLLNGNARGEYGIDLEYEDYGRGKRNDSAVDDGDMEDFIPGSLTDLLTPEERSRRMSRSGSSAKPLASALTAGAPSNLTPGEGTTAPAGNRLGHRYSSSVPAPSLLGDIKSIWSDTSVGALPGSPSAQPTHRGTPSASFASRFEGLTVSGQQGTNDDMGLSMSMSSTGAASSLGMMSPSNASAAFLPGLHHNYLKAKASKQAQLGLGNGAGTGMGGLSRGLRGTSNPLFPSGTTTNLSSNYLSGMSTNQGFPSSANNNSTLSQLPSYRGAPSPFDLTQPMHQAHSQAGRPIPTADNKRLGVGLGSGGIGGFGAGAGAGGLGVGAGLGVGGANGEMGGMEGEIMTGQFLSPNTRALQAHAPGQSLPQGLAAGYSRIHALPPLLNLTSPGVASGGTFPSSVADTTSAGPGVGGGVGAGGSGVNVGANANTTTPVREEWGASSLPPQTSPLTAPARNTTTNTTTAPNNDTSAAVPSTAGPAPTNNATLAPGTGYGGVPGASPGLESVLSKLSYSAAAKGGPGTGSTVSSSPTPPGLLKGAAGRYNHSGLSTPGGLGHGGVGNSQGVSSSSSPLRPRDDDDELFAMDK